MICGWLLDFLIDFSVQNSEDGVNDGDEGQQFEQSMETYPEYSVSNMVNVEDHKRYQLANFEDDSKNSKRHCTEIEDEYDAIGTPLFIVN